MSAAAIEVEGLQKSYGTKVALHDVSFTITEGEIFALLGPNGAGKTTTVEILEGYRARSAGTVRVLGVDPADPIRAWRSRIGIVLQSSKISDEITVNEALELTGSYYAKPRRASDVIDMVGLADKRDVRVSKLSGGQQRRLDVGLAIIGRPDLLFLDEPTTGFDPEARRQFWSLIQSLRNEGTTMLLTTHYLDEAEVLADRLGVVSGGRMVEIATPEHLGGRQLAPSTVRWTGPDGVASRETENPTKFIAELSEAFHGEIPGLTVSRPSLEDTYLRMITEAGP